MSTKEQMNAAIAAMEQAVTDLATAYGEYAEAYEDAVNGVYAASGTRAQEALEHVVGPHRVRVALAYRLRALGLPVDVPTHGPGLDATWTTDLTEKITHHVP
jgi:hypothetical protein